MADSGVEVKMEDEKKCDCGSGMPASECCEPDTKSKEDDDEVTDDEEKVDEDEEEDEEEENDEEVE